MVAFGKHFLKRSSEIIVEVLKAGPSTQLMMRLRIMVLRSG